MQSFLHVYFHIMVGFYQKLVSFLCIILTIVSYPRDTPYHFRKICYNIFMITLGIQRIVPFIKRKFLPHFLLCRVYEWLKSRRNPHKGNESHQRNKYLFRILPAPLCCSGWIHRDRKATERKLHETQVKNLWFYYVLVPYYCLPMHSS